MPTAEETFINDAIRANTGAWFESRHCKIFGKDRKQGLIRPKINYLQQKIQAVLTRFDLLELPVRVIILKPRQKGSTTYGTALDYTMLRRAPTSAVVIGGQVSQVAEAWGMLQTYSKNDTFDWGGSGEINSKAGSWSNGSKLIQETAGDAVAGIGGTHQCLHCFEVAKWAEHGVSNSSEVLTNIMKCVPLLPDTLINLESTAEGQTGAFYEHWIQAVDAEDFLSGAVEVKPGGFVRCFAAFFQFEDSAIHLDDDQKKEIERTLDMESWYDGEKELIEKYGITDEDGVMRLGDVVKDCDVWEQLAWRRWSIEVECKKDKTKFERDAPHSWQTAFQKSGNQRFSLTGLAALRKRLGNVTPKHGILEEAQGRRVVFRQTPFNEAKVTIFEVPTRGFRYLFSNDVMTGITQTGGLDPDRHGGFILRAGYWDQHGKWVRPATAARIVQCRWDIDFYEAVVWPLSRFYGGTSGCVIAIEMNQDRGLTELLKLRGANLYMREVNNLREQRTTKALGYLTNEKTRETMIETLAGAIREHDKPGDGVDIYCPLALEQCDNFVRKLNGRSEAAEGHKDDDVISIAMGLELIGHATVYTPLVTIPGFNGPGYREPQEQRRPSAYS